MSKVAIQGNASGSGVFTIAAPNTNSDRTLTLPDNSGTVITTASTGGVSQAMLETLVIPIGVGQTWQRLDASRAKGVTYTNTTGRSIFISIYASSDGGTNASMVVGGEIAFITVNGYIGAIFALVPPGATYSLSIGAGSVFQWNELR